MAVAPSHQLLGIGGALFGLLQLAAARLQSRGRTADALYCIMNDLFQMPRTMRQLAVVQFLSWFGLFAPAATPVDIVERLNAAIGKVLALPDVKEYYATQNVEILLLNPVDFAKKVRIDHDKWGKLIREAGLKAGN